VIALVLQWFPWLLERGAFALLLGCVFLSTWFGGWRSGGLAILLSVGLTAYLMEPNDSFTVASSKDWIRLGIFTVVAVMVALLHASRSKAMDLARVSEERLGAALSAARMGAWDRNLKDGSFWWSAGVEEIFGQRPGSFVPTYEDFLGYIHPEDREFVTKAFTKSVENGMEFEIEHRIVRADNDVRWIITRGQILFGKSGTHERLLGVAVDVTDRHRARGEAEEVVSGIAGGSQERLTAMRGRL
jgi:PAS domain S-box-containing protein